jgi:hypothetical protein
MTARFTSGASKSKVTIYGWPSKTNYTDCPRWVRLRNDIGKLTLAVAINGGKGPQELTGN